MTTRLEVSAALAQVYSAADVTAALDTQALMGEPVEIIGQTSAAGLIPVRLIDDGYRGFMCRADLGEPLAHTPTHTHRVNAPQSLLYGRADFKSPPIATLTLGARVAIVDITGRYARLADGRFMIARHLAPVSTTEADPVEVAERLLGAPYLWGGKSMLGIDCSGLVQLSFGVCGIRLPRDTGPQEKVDIGRSLPPETALQRGDLLFWKGHVAIARGDGSMIHANAHHMAVAYEGIRAGIARIAAAGDPVTSIRRVLPTPA
jgi:cell wall-associated NlpC family hydrolase